MTNFTQEGGRRKGRREGKKKKAKEEEEGRRKRKQAKEMKEKVGFVCRPSWIDVCLARELVKNAEKIRIHRLDLRAQKRNEQTEKKKKNPNTHTLNKLNAAQGRG